MITPFLRTLATEVVAQHTDALHRATVVLPGRHSAIVFKQFLVQLIQKPFIAPRILIMPEFISSLAGRSTVSSDELLMMLYQCHSELLETEADSFSEFLKWGPSLITDFSDIELSLVEEHTIFRDLKSISEIQNWSFNDEELTEGQLKYARFWDHLGELYSLFRHRQDALEKPSYAHLVHALALQMPQIATDDGFIWFAGFSSIRPAEDAIIRHFVENGRGRLMLDGDRYYVRNVPGHEAGKFLRSRSSSEVLFSDGFDDVPKHLYVTNTSSALAEVQAACNLLATLNADQLRSTGVVLLRDAYLSDFLKRMPQLPVPVHISMELPLSATASNAFLNKLLRIMHRADARVIFHEDLLSLLAEPALSHLGCYDLSHFASILVSQTAVYITEHQLRDWLPSHPLNAHLILCLFATETNAALAALDEVLNLLYAQPTDAVMPAVLNSFQKSLLKVNALRSKYLFLNERQAATSLLCQFIRSESVSFQHHSGEGLQVMSMVETRAVDLERWIFVGATEDCLPGKVSYRSLIPFDLRQFHGLPLPEDTEATFAYTFYRAISKASHIHLICSESNESFDYSEKSRYIAQLRYELPRYGTMAQYSEDDFRFAAEKQHKQNASMPANKFTKERMRLLFERGISPSAINKFCTCPLDFYYRYILGLPEREEVETSMDVSTFGTIVHDVLEHWLKAFIGRFPTKEDISEFKRTLPDRVLTSVQQHYNAALANKGVNWIAKNIAMKMLEKVAEFEEQRLESGVQRTIEAVEKPLQAKLVANDALPLDVCIRGISDRVDRAAGVTEIIDYKTGKVQSRDVHVSSDRLDSIFAGMHGKTVQLLMYALMLHKEGIPASNIRSSLFSLRNHKAGLQTLAVDNAEALNDEVMNTFETLLRTKLSQMWNLSEFTHAPNAQHCEYCNR